MGKTLRYLTGPAMFMSLFSCASLPSATSRSSTPSGPRTIIVNGEAISEVDAGGFTSWIAKDFVEGGPVLLEVGFFGNPLLKGFGFVLYDGGNTGERALYRRTGLEHRWDSGPRVTDYALVIRPDGTGLYYDSFSDPSGESAKATRVYKCHQR